MSEREVQAGVDDIATLLDAGVTLDDLTGHLIAYSAQRGNADDARVRTLLNREAPEEIRAWQAHHGTGTAVEPIVIPANADLKMQARICIPLIHRGVRTGLLFIIDPSAPADPTRIGRTVVRIRDHLQLLATLLYEMASPHLDERHQRERQFVDACRGNPSALAGVATWRAVRSAKSLTLAVSIFAAEHGVGAVSEARAAQVRLSRQQAVSRYPSLIASSVHDTHAVVLLRPDDEPNPAVRLHRCLAGASRVGEPGGETPGRLYTGVAESVLAITELPRAYRHATIAAQTAAVEPEYGAVARWADIGAYRIIGTRMRTDGPVSELLETLIRADSSGELLNTLEVLYDHDDNIQAVADSLHLHRTSLYYRLNKIRSVLGIDPLNGAVRLELHVALKARRWERRPRIIADQQPD